MKKSNQLFLKGLLVIILTCNISTLCPAQRLLTVKLYTGFYYLPSKYTPGSAQEIGVLGLEAIHTSISWQRASRNRQELSLFGVSKNISHALGKDEYYKIGLRYEYNFMIKEGVAKKMCLYIGGGAGIFYARLDKMPKDVGVYRTHYKVREVILHAIPRLTYRLNDKFILDCNILVSILNYGYNTRFSDNPSWKEGLGVFEFRSLEKVFAFRVGIGYTI